MGKNVRKSVCEKKWAEKNKRGKMCGKCGKCVVMCHKEGKLFVCISL